MSRHRGPRADGCESGPYRWEWYECVQGGQKHFPRWASPQTNMGVVAA